MTKLFSSELFWCWMWRIAAVFNTMGVVVFILWKNELDGLGSGLHYDTWIGFVLVFGIGYYLVSRDLYKWRGIVIMGILAKIASATPQLWYLIFRRDEIHVFYLVPVITDYVFTLLFVFFLRFQNESNSGTGQRFG